MIRRALLCLTIGLLSCGEPHTSPIVDSGTPLPSAKCLDLDGDGVPGTGDCAGQAVVDCDDTNPVVHPGAAELCDGLDDNCDGQIDEGLPTVPYYEDLDGDGYGTKQVATGCGNDHPGQALQSGDCDDSNRGVRPGQPEDCNGLDDDCNGKIDDGLPVRDFFVDADGDGYGDPASTSLSSCASALKGYAPDQTDCDDRSATIHPGATEVCNKVDDNCDGQVDNGVVFVAYYADADGDGFGSASANADLSCAPLAGEVTNHTDCDDGNPAIHPGASEVCNGRDDNCEGTVDEGLPLTTYYADADGDGFGDPNAATVKACAAVPGRVTNPNDCNDANPTVKPGAPETCNGVDDDCNGKVDDGLTFVTYYVDADGDGFGNPGAIAVSACAPIAGKVTNKADCNDANPSVKPGAPEICNGVDDDCNGKVDDGLTFSSYYPDSDGDGYGAASGAPVSSCKPLAGKVTNNADCDDARAAVHPGATEICNALDDDCNGKVDDGLPTASYYVDGDGDGHGKAGSVATVSCAQPAGWVSSSDDCNDSVASTHPGAPELCNSVDDNCDGLVDNGVATQNYYLDVDRDGYGAVSSGAISSCAAIDGRVTNNTDCDDGNAAVHPGAAEVCNGVDDNCNAQVDEGLTVLAYYPDADGDGYGASSAAAQNACAPVAGKVSNNGDCNDGSAAIHPGAAEACNGVDDNCNAQVDEGLPTQSSWADGDGDGYGAGPVQVSCAVPSGRVTTSGDCNDANAAVHPGASERCNGVDDNCDGAVDEGNPEGGAACTTGQKGVCAAGTRVCGGGALSCVRTTAPTAERCNGLDDNCDGTVDEGFTGLGTACTSGLGVCQRPGSMVCNASGTATTCGATPGAPTASACDGLDNDCDGVVDEPVLSATTDLSTTAWSDLEVRPYYYSATGCAGGVNGAGTDALAGGALLMAGGSNGITFQPLTTTGAPTGSSVQFTSEPYSDVDFAQAGDGFVVAGVWATNNAEIDLYYVDASGSFRGYRYTNFKYPSGCITSCHTLDSLRVVRGNGRRVTLVWREAGNSLNFSNLEICPVAGSWEFRAPGCASTTLLVQYFTLPSMAAGLGADSTHQDWGTSQSCASAGSQRAMSIAYLYDARTLNTFTMNEDGSLVSADTTVRTVLSPDTLAAPELTYFKDGANADQFSVSFVSRFPSDVPAEADLDYWQTNAQSWSYAWSALATQNGAASIDRARTSTSPGAIQLTALRAVSDASSFKKQIMTRTLDTAGNRTPLGSAVEVPVTSGSCAGDAACRPGDKGAVTNWLPFKRIYYSASGSTPSGTYSSVLTCN